MIEQWMSVCAVSSLTIVPVMFCPGSSFLYLLGTIDVAPIAQIRNARRMRRN